ncbi:MAG: T6SS immunity protein Tli4 family protein [Aquabacterium sp.]
MTTRRRLHTAWCWTALAASLLTACQPSSAQHDDTEGQAPPRPTAAHKAEALQAGHRPAPGSRQECLGRLVWDVAAPGMEWGVMTPGAWNGDRFRFTEHLHGGHDLVTAANIQMVVLQPATRKDIERMLQSVDAQKYIAIDTYRERIEVGQRLVTRLQSKVDDPSLNTNGEDLSTYPAGIADLKKEISDDQTSIERIEADWQSLDLGLPDSLGYAAGPTLYAFLLRDGRAYRFMSTGGAHEAPFAERKKAFMDMLQRFRVRQVYEIPTEFGLCIPYGFIPDDGRGHFRMEVSWRYTDRPGVLYTIGTAVVGERGVPHGESPVLQATARAGASVLSGGLMAGRQVRSVGPRPVKIGALSAYQGGFSVNVADPGQPPVFSYNVYTGYGGWMHSRVLPAITVNLRSFTPEQDRSLKTNPPPFDESLQRLDAVLQSIRLRPTDQPMPEMLEVP